MSRNSFHYFPRCGIISIITLMALINISILSGYTTTQEEAKCHKEDEPMFQRIQNQLYDKATNSSKVNPERRPFTLDGWEFGSGGLSDEDRILIGEYYRNASSVFEFGLGESTKIAAHVGVPRYSGVDSDAVWVSTARDASMDHFRFTFADIGQTKLWGKPVNAFLPKVQYNYQIAPLLIESLPFDFYMVDGRYRVACACLSLLHAMSRGGDMSKVLVAIHDSWRGIYFQYFGKVAEIVEKSDRLNVYKLRSGVTENDIFDVWEKVAAMEKR